MPDHLEQAPAGVVVFRVGLEMLRQHVDPLGEDAYLHLRRSGVDIVLLEAVDDLQLALFVKHA